MGNMRRVRKEDWEQALADIALGKEKPPYEKTAAFLGMTTATLKRRLLQATNPDLYGPLPTNFFYEEIAMVTPHEELGMEMIASRTIPVFSNGALPDFTTGKDPAMDMMEGLKRPKRGRPKKIKVIDKTPKRTVGRPKKEVQEKTDIELLKEQI